ncbi:histidinol-phosphate transaminase [Sedimenticola thiotaurini]|uniref:Histidinol-phosphate aminotransferase n=1 Tax=Sedimenticola thiotaurini TaxID=1543721 RepID=A0A0F7JWM0_9GAMM|nr:histidinol-phosphate transaminase [Sedimenticola thiotaurini]AKH19754.1 aspartate aminotransferase [Sedimenticola thiotaurini]
MTETANRFLEIAVPAVTNLKPYVPGKPISELERELGITDSVKLASNENPLGCSELAKEAVRAELAQVGLYPDGGGVALRNALAEKHGVSPNQITLGNGSNDVLDMIARVFLAPGLESLFSQYAFAVYPISSQAVGATLNVVPARDYGHDLEEMLNRIGEKTRVVWIANPNNPTGTWLNGEELEGFIAAVPSNVIVVVDEAYIEYVDEPDYPDASLWLDKYPNLVVTRTFSKSYGLASLRVGYGLAHADITDLLNRVRQPFNVNSMALAAARAALEDQAFIQRSVEMNRAGMAQMTAAFEAMGLSYIPSVGNFITVDLGRPAAEVDQGLLQAGCITRPVANYGLPNHLRITIGTESENSRVLAALKQVLGK